MLEGQLRSFLNPIVPRPEFVSRLKHRLTTEPPIIIERRSEAAALVILAFGLFFGALLVWIGFVIRSLTGRNTTAAN